MSIFTEEFLEATGERAVKSLAQGLLTALTMAGTGLIDTDWVGVLSTSGMMAVLSILTSVAFSGVGGEGPAAFGPETIEPDGK